MSKENNDSGHAGAVIGASLLMLFFATILIKAMKQFFIELGQSFEAFGNMTGSFVSMLWNVFQVVALVSMTVAGLVCAIYFTIQYCKMVKEGCALRDSVQKSLEGFEEKLMAQMNEIKKDVSHQIYEIDWRLTKELEKPEVAPVTQPAAAASKVKGNVCAEDFFDEEDDSEPDEFQDTEDLQEDETPSDDQFVTMSNPY